ncbi:MAG: type I restriction-modification system subunit M [Lachnospiraceae bacterium]
MNKQQLAAKIWESANKMRSKIEANEYKDYILGFIFYKFLSDMEIKYLKELGYTDEDLNTVTLDDEETVNDVRKNKGYFISYENLFSTWLSKGSDFNVADVRDALSAFNRMINPTHKKVFSGVFDTLQTGLSKLGDSSNSQTKAISDLLYLIKDIPMDGKQDYDVLGFIYEYLISNFAANAGKKAGEFYTPHEVSLLMSEIVAEHLKEKTEIKIYDPTSGSGSLLINIGKSVSKNMGNSDHVKYYAQELKENTFNLTRMNLVMRGIKPDNIAVRNGDTLEEDWPYFDESDPIGTYEPLYVDAVVSNPPYSQNWNPAGRESDPRYAGFGLAPKSKADYAFLLHDLYHLKPDGIMTIVLPHGVLFRGGEEGEIRKNLIEKNHIDAVIGLPANIFFGTGIPTIIMVLKQKRPQTDVLIIDASKGFEKSGKNNKLRSSDIKKITDVVTNRQSVEKFSRVVSRDEIRENDYNLNIPRYVDSSEKAENWDIYASMFGGIPAGEIEELHEYWDAFPGLKEALFRKRNEAYFDLRTEDIKREVQEHSGVQNFIRNYASAFEGFDEFVEKELLQSMSEINISKEESVLSENVFSSLERMPLVDKYEAYQILDDDWNKIAIDLEIIQTEGFEATKQVDPNLIAKKKDGKDQEVQDGWIGHVLPFELVQKMLLSDDLTDLKKDEDRLSEIMSGYEEALDALSEEEKEKEFISEDKTFFVWAEVKKAIKAKEVEEDVFDVLKRVSDYNEEEKRLKKQIKDKGAALHMKTKETIENLTDAQVYELLKEKWIIPMLDSLSKLPDSIVSDFVSRLEKLISKYDTTLSEIEQQISETEKELCSMLDMLTGNDFDMQGIAELKKMFGGIWNG